jgi:hypothetical protein
MCTVTVPSVGVECGDRRMRGKLNNRKNAINVGVTVDRGLVIEKMQSLGPNIVRRSFRRALKTVGTMWVGEMKAKVPVLDGDLQNSIIMKISTRLRKEKGTGDKLPEGKVEVGPRLDYPRSDGKKSVGPGVYGMFVEFGLKHKQYPAQPFARPVYDATADRAVTMFAEILGSELGEVAKLTSVEKE